MIRQRLKNLIIDAVRTSFGDIQIPQFSIEVPENPEHGDYSTNIAMLVAKVLKKNPMEIAANLAKELAAVQEFEKAEATNPGFINVVLKDDFLMSHLNEVVSAPHEMGDYGKGKTVVVEYFQLNIAKSPHVGHLRSAVIGDSIKRMLLSQGYHAISDTHVGDWGTQFGFLLLKYKKLVPTQQEIFISDISATAKAYTEIVEKAEDDPEVREQAKAEFAKLEHGDGENRKIWKKLVSTSMEELKKSAGRLGLLPFEEHRGESAYEKDMSAIVEEAIKKGIAQKKADGAIVVDLNSEKLDEAVLIKSDGASTYLLRDLATIKYRKERWSFWKNLYLVDIRQSHHFRQVFRVAELLGFEGVGESEHVDFGFMSLPEGPMSTRKGTAISLDAVLDEASKRAINVIEKKNPDLEGKEEAARKVGLGALKYFDLSHHRKSDIVFSWDNALSFEGNTGPYLQYTYARFKSILRKAEELDKMNAVTLDNVEHNLLVSTLRLQEVIEDALKDFTPNTLANYLYHLAQKANEFYHSHPVLQEQDQDKKQLRLALAKRLTETLARGLWCLGIEVLEEM